ncbi:N-acetyltransferase family protein [Maribacter sp. 2307UL18-2]|uniref:GNAT family N-acetyltransferase n=1 Tax=Maribacter sp. 2307UL18-2 TaxID=3386274 RepID=UPI0039BCA792
MEHIRQASTEDAQHISRLGRITFTEAFGHLFRDANDLNTYLDTTFNAEKITDSLQKSDNLYWIAFSDERPVGYAKLKLRSSSEFLTSDKVSQLQKIYVLNDFLSMKIGKRLQDILLAKARESGAKAIWLSVLNSNQRAIGFYEKNDFRAIGSHQFRIGRERFDFTVMSKQFF